ncbi:VOC family protein [Clostridium oryzae]|uniref:PhnB-like domain-containing protein n=1 Tax=Clostridium oryzae TaxID=1450648 RepID=A0A1V4IJU9_9CLOT|nr:glyoxalase/bleomycin resistance/extradiol dioxygenase family protein [Clostridium oryzae]OPJ60196.1 hypothetical protein CLORY_29170 [Clostridium oryzae]
MALQTYLYFKGNCREAIEFYSKVFETEEPQIMLFGNMPVDDDFARNEEMENLILHAELKIKDSRIMLSDVPPGMPFVIGNNISLFVSSRDMDEIKLFFNRLKVDGNVIMELEETAWSKCYGLVEDKFGVRWQLSYDKE